jgi:hypothetical protein
MYNLGKELIILETLLVYVIYVAVYLAHSAPTKYLIW